MDFPINFARQAGQFKSWARIARSWLRAYGIQPGRTLRALRQTAAFGTQYRALRTQNEKARLGWKIVASYPCLLDALDSAGTASGHYFHQDLLVARRIFAANPDRHLDVGSRVDGFVAHVAVFREIEVLDIRPISAAAPNMTFTQCDLMDPPEDFVECCDSLSCLHALEHFGLARYGDRLDIAGYLTGFRNLERMLKPGGVLYLSVPIGEEHIAFNAHRIFAPSRILAMASNKFVLERFSYVDDAGLLHEDMSLSPEDAETGLGLHYGCGIFELRKRSSSDE